MHVTWKQKCPVGPSWLCVSHTCRVLFLYWFLMRNSFVVTWLNFIWKNAPCNHTIYTETTECQECGQILFYVCVLLYEFGWWFMGMHTAFKLFWKGPTQYSLKHLRRWGLFHYCEWTSRERFLRSSRLSWSLSASLCRPRQKHHVDPMILVLDNGNNTKKQIFIHLRHNKGKLWGMWCTWSHWAAVLSHTWWHLVSLGRHLDAGLWPRIQSRCKTDLEDDPPLGVKIISFLISSL